MRKRWEKMEVMGGHGWLSSNRNVSTLDRLLTFECNNLQIKIFENSLRIIEFLVASLVTGHPVYYYTSFERCSAIINVLIESIRSNSL